MKLKRLEISRGLGGGGGVFEKIPSVGEVWIFSGTTHGKIGGFLLSDLGEYIKDFGLTVKGFTTKHHYV